MTQIQRHAQVSKHGTCYTNLQSIKEVIKASIQAYYKVWNDMVDGSKSPNQCKNVMLYTHTLKANKPECKGAILGMPNSTQTTMDRPKTWQNMHKTFTKLSLKHAWTRANNLRHIKAITWHYMVGMLSMHGVPKPTKNRGIIWHIKHKKQPRHGQHEA